MRYLKMLGLAALALSALTAFAASAPATVLTSPTGTVYTGPVTIEEELVFKLDGSFTAVECKFDHLEFNVEQHGPGVTVKGNLQTHSIGECNFPVTVLKAGAFEIHATKCPANGIECTGTITSTGTEMSIETSVGKCVFTTSSTDFGLITPTNDTNGHATIDTESSKLPRTGGSILCGSSATMTGSHTISTPATLWIDS